MNLPAPNPDEPREGEVVPPVPEQNQRPDSLLYGFGLQAGDKSVDPDEPPVSDSGERVQPTHLQRVKNDV